MVELTRYFLEMFALFISFVHQSVGFWRDPSSDTADYDETG